MDRAISTLKRAITRRQASKGGSWLSNLDAAVQGYNKSHHSAIDTAPQDMTDDVIFSLKKEAAEDEKKDNIKRIQRQINKSRDDERKAKMRVSVARRDVDDDRKGFFNRSKDTEEDKRLEDIKLFNEREKLEMIQEERAALEGEKAKAEAAPISINAPTNNVVNQSKQESTITQPIAMNATGSTAALARGGGFMSSGIGE